MRFRELAAKRRSVRKFTQEKISQEIIDSLIETTLTAPSSKNTRSTRIAYSDDKIVLAKVAAMRTTGSAFVKDAAAAIVVLGDTAKTDLWVDNCAISATFVHLAATAMDLGSCWVHVNGRYRSASDPSAGLAGDYLEELLGVKDGFKCYCVIALGYPEEQ